MIRVVFSLPEQEEFLIIEGEEELIQNFSNDQFVFQDFRSGKVYGIDAKSAKRTKAPKLDWKLESLDETEISKSLYLEKVTALIDVLKAEKLKKLVWSRSSFYPLNSPDLNKILISLRKAYPQAFVYGLNSERFGTWIGASPELLLRGNAGHYQSTSLAGTKAKGENAWTSKEYEEQQMVTDYILQVLSEVNAENTVLTGPNTVSAGPVEHLKTNIEFDFSGSPDKLLFKLSPTPAVCGLPKDTAREYILRNESHERLLYSSLIGLYSQSETQLFVNLRCMQLGLNGLKLYLGGGITASSNAEDEWKETELKAKTLLDIL
jgi:isochorismate synthase